MLHLTGCVRAEAPIDKTEQAVGKRVTDVIDDLRQGRAIPYVREIRKACDDADSVKAMHGAIRPKTF